MAIVFKILTALEVFLIESTFEVRKLARAIWPRKVRSFVIVGVVVKIPQMIAIRVRTKRRLKIRQIVTAMYIDSCFFSAQVKLLMLITR